MGVLDRQRAERAKGARDLEMGDDDHHAQKQRDRVPVDGVKCVVEAHAAEGDHRRAAKKRDAGAIEAQAGYAPNRHAAVNQDEDDQGGEAFGGHGEPRLWGGRYSATPSAAQLAKEKSRPSRSGSSIVATTQRSLEGLGTPKRLLCAETQRTDNVPGPNDPAWRETMRHWITSFQMVDDRSKNNVIRPNSKR